MNTGAYKKNTRVQVKKLKLNSVLRQMYSDCSLRVFTLGNRKDDLDKETRK